MTLGHIRNVDHVANCPGCANKLSQVPEMEILCTETLNEQLAPENPSVKR